MKYIFFILAISLLSCTKETMEPSKPVMAVTFYIDQYDSNWRYQFTFVSLHVHKITDEDVAYYRQFDKPQLVCIGETKLQRIVVSVDTCKQNEGIR